MTDRDAEAALAGAELATYAQVSLDYGKEIAQACLEEDIPAMLVRDASCATGGCSPTVKLVVRAEDLDRTAALLQRQWTEMAAREGTFDPAALAAAMSGPVGDDDAEPPCPACGTAAPLVEGACQGCGLVLE